VHRAHILDGRIAHVLLLEIFTDAGIGTMVLGERVLGERVLGERS
jgi:acetylglutamate kinase